MAAQVAHQHGNHLPDSLWLAESSIGIAFYTGAKYPDWKGSLFAGYLRGLHLARLTFAGGKVASQEKLFSGFSRFRNVVQRPGERLSVLTDEPSLGGGLYVFRAAGDATWSFNARNCELIRKIARRL